MKRRSFCIASASTAFAWPSWGLLSSPARAAAKVWRIGMLHPRSRLPAGQRDIYTDFIQGMRELGYVEGRNLTLHWQSADNALDRLPALAAALVNERVDVIVTNGTPSVRAAQQATRTIPTRKRSGSRSRSRCCCRRIG